jgi:phosphoenolpyruvate synthase/pyruvate phosphate dikinase
MRSLSDLRRADIALVGGKNASLGVALVMIGSLGGS